MIKAFKKIILIAVIMLIVAAIIKNSFYDTPSRSIKLISYNLHKLNQNDLETNIFNTKKKLVYKIYYWSLIPLGEFSLSTEPTLDTILFSIKSTTEDSYMDRFIQASISIESYLDKKDRLTSFSREITNVRGKEKIKELKFDRKNLIVIRNDTKTKIFKDTCDWLGSFINMLVLPFELGKPTSFKLLSKDEIYDFTAEPVEFRGDSIKILVNVERDDFTSIHGAKFFVWITSGNARVPLVFKGWTPFGYLSAVLSEIEIEGP